MRLVTVWSRCCCCLFLWKSCPLTTRETSSLIVDRLILKDDCLQTYALISKGFWLIYFVVCCYYITLAKMLSSWIEFLNSSISLTDAKLRKSLVALQTEAHCSILFREDSLMQILLCAIWLSVFENNLRI